jgi:hypothetical protein
MPLLQTNTDIAHSRGLSLAASFHVTTIPQKQSPNARLSTTCYIIKKQSLRFPKPEGKKEKKNQNIIPSRTKKQNKTNRSEKRMIIH